MRKYFLYACLLFAGVFTACDNDDSDGIDPSIPFYQNLGVEYNVTQNHTHIGANFNKYNSEGANLRLPAKGILFNGKVPDFLGMGTYMYMLSESGLYNPQNQKSRFQKRKIKKTANDLLIAFIV